MPAAIRFDAVIFDLDGTLIDTESLCNSAGVAACADLGLDVSLRFFESLAGIHDAERVRLIAAHIGHALDAQAFFDHWDARCSLRFAQGVPLKPGVHQVLGALQARGLPLAVATSSRRGPATDKITLAGLMPYFRTVVTIDDVARAKPLPDPYLLAAERLSVIPSRCIAFEDSETGARSAQAAGMTVVQIPDIHPTDGRHAHHVAASLMAGAQLAGLLVAQGACVR